MLGNQARQPIWIPISSRKAYANFPTRRKLHNVEGASQSRYLAMLISKSVSVPITSGSLRLREIMDYADRLNTFFENSYILLREPGKTPILPFTQCLIALRFSSGDQTYDMLDIECLLVSLMDQVCLVFLSTRHCQVTLSLTVCFDTTVLLKRIFASPKANCRLEQKCGISTCTRCSSHHREIRRCCSRGSFGSATCGL